MVRCLQGYALLAVSPWGGLKGSGCLPALAVPSTVSGAHDRGVHLMKRVATDMELGAGS